MSKHQLTDLNVEKQLLSRESTKLPPRQRLELLMKAKKYPIVKKKTAAERQITEMINFYDLCCLMLAQYFPNESAKNNFIMLNYIRALKSPSSILPDKLAEAFKLLDGYEDLEKRVTAIQDLFCQYQYSFPDLYEYHCLYNIATTQISDIIQETNQLILDDPHLIEENLKCWDLLP